MKTVHHFSKKGLLCLSIGLLPGKISIKNRVGLLLAAVILMVCNLAVSAQNVGVNKTNPTQALDVNGSIQLNGSFMVNGNPGQSGQVLSSTGGGLQWIDAMAAGYKRFSSAFNTATSSYSFGWTKPAGVTEVMIEAWAGGGGGSSGGGGGGGGYAALIIDVTNVNQISIEIGGGGLSSPASKAVDGGNTVISWTQGANVASLSIPGGIGANITRPGGYLNAFSTSNLPSNASLFTFPGNPGAPTKTYYSQNSSTTYVTIVDGGSGGGTYKHHSNGGAGHNYAITAANTLNVLNEATLAGVPGGGAGSSYRLGTANQNTHRGGGGMAIIRW